MGAADAGQYLIAVFRALLAVHSSQALYAEALFLHAQSGLSQDGISWRDSLIVSAAIQTRCEILFSEDLQHGRRFGALRVMNPFL
jgi:predicted nucleic acid-binding protein